MKYLAIIFIPTLVLIAMIFAMYQQPKVFYKTVNTPPTDQQLIDFWFGGTQDQSELRKRICK